MGNMVAQTTVVDQATPNPNLGMGLMAFFNEDGTPFGGFIKQVTVGNAIGTAGKTTASDEPPAGSLVAVTFTNGNSAETPTVNFNSAGARAIKLGGTASAAAKITVAAGGVVLFFFDGTVLHQLGVVS